MKEENLRSRSAKGGETWKICRLKVETTNPKALTSLCANIRLHRGWHAPCELPRTRSSSALVVGLWSHAQNIHRRKQGNMYTALLKRKQTHGLQKELIYVQS
jgi:hypothetical protein